MHDIEALRRVIEYTDESPKATAEPPPEGWPKELERRGAQRHFYRVEGFGNLTRRKSSKPVTAEADFPLIGLTLSRTGVSFLANDEFQLGDILTVTVPSADGGRRNLVIRVVRCRRKGLGACEIGGEFTELEAKADSPDAP